MTSKVHKTAKRAQNYKSFYKNFNQTELYFPLVKRQTQWKNKQADIDRQFLPYTVKIESIESSQIVHYLWWLKLLRQWLSVFVWRRTAAGFQTFKMLLQLPTANLIILRGERSHKHIRLLMKLELFSEEPTIDIGKCVYALPRYSIQYWARICRCSRKALRICLYFGLKWKHLTAKKWMINGFSYPMSSQYCGNSRNTLGYFLFTDSMYGLILPFITST